jgi:hypothetical protein
MKGNINRTEGEEQKKNEEKRKKLGKNNYRALTSFDTKQSLS